MLGARAPADVRRRHRTRPGCAARPSRPRAPASPSAARRGALGPSARRDLPRSVRSASASGEPATSSGAAISTSSRCSTMCPASVAVQRRAPPRARRPRAPAANAALRVRAPHARSPRRVQICEHDGASPSASDDRGGHPRTSRITPSAPAASSPQPISTSQRPSAAPATVAAIAGAECRRRETRRAARAAAVVPPFGGSGHHCDADRAERRSRERHRRKWIGRSTVRGTAASAPSRTPHTSA